MCMFCAAVPAVLAAGTAKAGQERTERRAAEARGEVPRAMVLPVGKLTSGAVTVLVIAAVINHTRPGGLV